MAGGNGKRRPPGAQVVFARGEASPEEAAAVVAGLERFLIETAPVPVPAQASRWQRTALREGVRREPRRESWGPS